MALDADEQKSQMALRDVGSAVYWIWLVDPEGYPRRVASAKNINNGHTFVDDSGRTRLLGVREEEGWKFLQAVITPAEYREWQRYQARSQQLRGRIKPMPDELWPKSLKRPGERNASSEKEEYSASAPLQEVAPRGVTPGADADPNATTRGSQRRG